MRYAIVESGGKQYRAVEGEELEVDRLADDEGKQVSIERVLLMADGEQFEIGTPTLSGVEVKATVVEHFSGAKVNRFRYRPKKKIRVRGGHRQHYTRLMIDSIGGKGEVRRVQKPEPAPAEAPVVETSKKVSAKKAAAKKTAGKKPATKKSTK